MRSLLAIVGLATLQLATAVPHASLEEASLQARGGKQCHSKNKQCHYKNKQCCAVWGNDHYYDQHDSNNDYGGRRPGGYGHGSTIQVKHGHSIQQTINRASRGDKIIVPAGNYYEQLIIDKDGITLEGHGAVLMQPDTPSSNKCTGVSGKDKHVGICILGRGVTFSEFRVEHARVASVDRLVKDVTVTGFEVRGFSGIDILVAGASNARVVNNRMVDGGNYGGLTVGSTDTVFADNLITASGADFRIAVCMDNESGVLVTNNEITQIFIGICVQTDRADISHNYVHGGCIAVYVDPAVRAANIHHNHFGAPSPDCPAFASIGVLISGAVDTLVHDNLIEKQRGAQDSGVGVVIVDDACAATPDAPASDACVALGHPAVAAGNVVARNTFKDNDHDLFFDSTGKDNVATCNKCASPKELCEM